MAKRSRRRSFHGFAGSPQEHAKSAWVALNDLGDHTNASARYIAQGNCEGGFDQLQYASALKYFADRNVQEAGKGEGQIREWAKSGRADYNKKRGQFEAVEKEFKRVCMRR